MRGADETSGSLFSYVDMEARIPARHPLRQIRRVVNDALVGLDGEFEGLYAVVGRPSIPPERLIRASLLQILFSVRSERQLMEQMDYNLMFRWFVGLGIDDPVWVPTVFTKNRDRLLTTAMARKVMAAILAHREVAPLLSDEHFSVDGTLIKAWASMKSFQPRAESAPSDDEPPADPPGTGPDGEVAAGTGSHPPTNAPQDTDQDTTPETAPAQPDPETTPMPSPSRRHRNAEVDFRGQRRSNATHASTTDPDARLFRKVRRVSKGPSGAFARRTGTGAMLCYMGHTLMENRNGFIVQAELTRADGHAERRAALDMIHRHSPGSTRRLTLGADKGYDSADFVADLRQAYVTPHVAQKARHSAIDGRTTRHPGYALSQKHRKKIEEPFGWGKTVGGMAQTLHRGLDRVAARFTFTMTACNLARLPKLLAA
ncbi:IS5 family transposase [Rhodobaculum claviforme]|uniref:IS5/IS1182 family transposase n=1 Tax=Rhodobaculum claviforme TaxID=1549854 RepID=A0A934WHV0_9RHOB|nr:IS5 family transposase [Rhodobaculum claviforme]MBK5927525.1 IS5/IS1182 family transposase [Rhodobaculum claviforme]